MARARVKSRVKARPKARPSEMLPLLHILRLMKPQHRVVVMSHFDEHTRENLYDTIDDVLTSDRVPFRKRLFLKSKLSEHKKLLRAITNKAKTSGERKKRLLQFGGAPMSHLLTTALPLLLNLYK